MMYVGAQAISFYCILDNIKLNDRIVIVFDYNWVKTWAHDVKLHKLLRRAVKGGAKLVAVWENYISTFRNSGQGLDWEDLCDRRWYY